MEKFTQKMLVFKRLVLIFIILIFLYYLIYDSVYRESVAYIIQSRIINDNTLESEGISYVPKSDRFNIYIIWFGSNYPLLYFKCLETLVYHHPNADILIISNELSDEFIDPFRKNGFNNVQMVRFNLTKLVQNKPGYDFVIKATAISNGQILDGLKVTPVHLSDFLRYFLVYNYGGLYLDSDSFVLKNLEKLKNMISVSDQFTYVCSKRVFNAPRAKNFSCISNSIFHFEKNHPFLKDALMNYDIWWMRHQGYGPGGAIMLMELVEKNFDKINFYTSRELVCVPYIGSLRKMVNENDPDIKDALANCYTAQILGAGSSKINFDNFEKTFAGYLYKKYKIL